MSEETKTTRIEVQVHFLDNVFYQEYQVDAHEDFDFNEAGTILAIRQNSPADEPDNVQKKIVVIPVHRIKNVDIRYY